MIRALSHYLLDGVQRVERSTPASWPDPVGFRVAVTGGRTIADRDYVWNALDSIHFGEKFGPIVELGSGCARGVDKLCLEWAIDNRVPWRKYVADWDRYGDPAGAIRNEAMLLDFEADLLAIFDGGVGTTDCARKCRKLVEKRKLTTHREFFNRNADPLGEIVKWG